MRLSILWLLTKITFKQGIRRKGLHGIVLLSIVLFVSNLFITQLFSFDIGKVAVDIGFSVLSLAGLSILFFLSLDLLSKDIHQKNICMIISHPISRWEYVVGKFAGLSFFLFIAVGILGGFAIISLWLGTLSINGTDVFPSFSLGMLFITILFNLLALFVMNAIGFFFTVVTSSGYMSMLLTFFVYLIGNSLETITDILTRAEFINQEALGLLTFLKAVSWIVPNLSAFNLKTYLAYDLSVSAPYLLSVFVYGLTYIGILLWCTAVILQKKDLS